MLLNKLDVQDIGEKVTVSGWVDKIREHGEMTFVDLRRRDGILQLKFSSNPSLKLESVIEVFGEIAERPVEAKRGKNIELLVSKFKILNESKPLPIDAKSNEEMKLKYRYLDLRNDLSYIRTRHEVVHAIRNFLNSKDFWEVETPLLTKSTPEGARDFVVPSRTYPDKFYALPQSPQQYKELLMCGGIERYFQIAKCLRDEDGRADRQIEHTQIDMEMSFVNREDVLKLLEELMSNLCVQTGKNYSFCRMTYSDAMKYYGTDKPDLRFGLKIGNVDLENLPFECVGKIHYPEKLSRKELDELSAVAKVYKGKLGSVVNMEGKLGGSFKKFAKIEEVSEGTHLYCDNLIALGQVRTALGKKMELADKLVFAFIIDFPLFEWDEDRKRFDPVHHMFTRPLAEDEHLLDTDPLTAKSTQYDMTCNGYEICSGSIRINTREMQTKIMKLIGMGDEEIESKFGHLLEAFDYGCPPHGGAAPGLDRLLMMLTDTNNIKDVIAFPKSNSGQDLMMNAPSEIDDSQKEELHLKG